MMQIDRFELHTAHVGHDLTMRSIELFATEVKPMVLQRLGATAAEVRISP